MEDARLLTSSALELAGAIRSGEFTSTAVVQAHVGRLKAAAPKTNAVVFDRYQAALDEAEAVDRLIAEAGGSTDDLPPLLGVPCTIKESFELVGMPNSAGAVHRKDIRSTTTAPPVQRLIDAGAIPLGVTNISELTLWIESDNRVYGRASCAYDSRRIAGGSSGGEGVAVGSGGSPFGLGSDIAGSIRVPAFFNGVFGHKPSHGVIPNTGQWPHAEGSAAELLTAGPIARRAEDLMPLMRILAGPDGVDDNVAQVELGDPAAVEIAGLDVLVASDASFFPTSRELFAARERAAGALAARGAKVREVSLKSLRRALAYLLASLSAAGGDSVKEMLTPAGERTRTTRELLRERRELHTWPTIWLLLAEAVAGDGSDRFTQRQVAAGRALADEFDGVVGDGVLLHQPHSRVVPKHGSTVSRPWAVQPTAIFNVTRSPVTQVPLGLNRKGLPLGVQVVAARGNDHVTIAVAAELERSFGGWVPPFDA